MKHLILLLLLSGCSNITIDNNNKLSKDAIFSIYRLEVPWDCAVILVDDVYALPTREWIEATYTDFVSKEDLIWSYQNDCNKVARRFQCFCATRYYKEKGANPAQGVAVFTRYCKTHATNTIITLEGIWDFDVAIGEWILLSSEDKNKSIYIGD